MVEGSTVLTESAVTTGAAPTLLAPTEIAKMLKERQRLQVVKFRTTCSDCVQSF